MNPHTILETEGRPSAAITAALALAINDPSKAVFEEAQEDRPALLLTQPDIKIISLERFQAIPHRPSIAVALDSARDLHAYILAQKGGDELTLNPVIFASRKHQNISAFIDYHHADGPRWLNHTVSVQYSPSHQFKRWQEMNNKQFTQEQFALFIDEMLQDFQLPTGSEMLSFATCLEAQSDQTFKSSTVLASGETELVFTDKRKGDVSTKIIDEFELAIPIWQGSEGNVLVTAKLFHRLVDNKDSAGAPTGTKSLRFWYTLRHIERIIDELFGEEVKFLRTAFDGIAPIYSGTAPATPQALAGF